MEYYCANVVGKINFFLVVICNRVLLKSIVLYLILAYEFLLPNYVEV